MKCLSNPKVLRLLAIMTSRAQQASMALFAAGCVVGCASTAKEAWQAPAPEVLVDLLPSSARLSVDGVALGPGARKCALPDGAHVYTFRAEAPGFLPAQRAEAGAALAGTRLAVVLRPEGFGTARRLDLDDAAGLASAAALLVRQKLYREALEYAERARDLAPELLLARRVLGDAALSLGQKKQAIAEYSAYLTMAPESAERRAVQDRVAALRGDIDVVESAPPRTKWK